MKLVTAVLLVIAGVQQAGANSIPGTGTCKEVLFSVFASAQNRNLTTAPLGDINALRQAIQADAFPRILTQGTSKIAGEYCEPKVRNANNQKLLVFYSSITNNRDAWSAQGSLSRSLGFSPFQPERYSWIDFFLLAGYPTLALDRLGNGKSDHPDPVLVTQGPYE